jgi:hypothetical protein
MDISFFANHLIAQHWQDVAGMQVDQLEHLVWEMDVGHLAAA